MLSDETIERIIEAESWGPPTLEGRLAREVKRLRKVERRLIGRIQDIHTKLASGPLDESERRVMVETIGAWYVPQKEPA